MVKEMDGELRSRSKADEGSGSQLTALWGLASGNPRETRFNSMGVESGSNQAHAG